VNGQVVKEMGIQIDPEKDEVRVDGNKVKSEAEKVYYQFYKPSGCVCTAHDPQGRPTVLDWFETVPERIYPVGRLDFESEGLLLLTNDGEFSAEVIHPRHHVAKMYTVLINTKLTDKQVQQLQAGVILDDQKTAPTDITYNMMTASGKYQYQFKLYEGKNRQIRRMCASQGARVVFIKRDQIGELTLNQLKPGEWKKITIEEARLALKND
jgi:pseudouridine synthase